jgi:regulator of RNase E activity RraA
VIPAHLAEEVARDSATQEQFEAFVIEKVREGRGIFGLYPPDAETTKEYEAWKAKRAE